MKTLIKYSFCILFLTSGSVWANCPDFSGTYMGTFVDGDFRSQEKLVWTQTNCDEYTLKGEMTFKRSSDVHKWDVTRKISDQPGDNVWYWENDELVFLSRDANSEHCDIRDIFYQDADRNLKTRWRFECPDRTTKWFINNLEKGTWYRQ